MQRKSEKEIAYQPVLRNDWVTLQVAKKQTNAKKGSNKTKVSKKGKQ